MEPVEKKMNLDTSTISEELKKKEELLLSTLLTYDVLRIIFQYLRSYDLCQAAQVCRSWNEAASEEAATRRTPNFDPFCLVIEYFEKFEKVPLVTKCPGEDLNITPSLGLIFVKIKEESENWLPHNCWCDNLPSLCKSVVLGGYDIVKNECDSSYRADIGAGIFLPKTADLNSKIFSLCNDDVSFTNNEYKELAQQILPSNEEESKCIIMLTNQRGYDFTKSLTKVLQKRYKPGSISLWGGITGGMTLCGESIPFDKSEAEDTSSRHTKYVCFTAITLSSPSLQSWSIVITTSCRSEEKIEEKLQGFKKSLNLKKHSVGLMFACCERLLNKGVEVSAFKKVFPNVCLYGLHGDGEIGLNTLNKSRDHQLLHSYATIFLILTYQ